MKNTYLSILFLSILALTFLSSCNMPSVQQHPGDPTPDLNLILTQAAAYAEQTVTVMESMNKPTEEPTPIPTAEPTPTPKKVETLTVCLGKEPSTLFFYDESSQAMWSVLEAIYDGPFDMGNGKADPVIFDEILVTTEPVTVVRGDIITDINGDAGEMKPGTVFKPFESPENCSGASCLSTWTALTEEAVIGQTVITFRLRENLTWSDGTPLTAEDSVFSMNVNGMKGINASKHIYNMTEKYSALDEHTLEWRGLPGFTPTDPSEVFWTPLPKHQMNGMSVEAIRASEEINRTPLGWGAWQISSWEKGAEIVADRNPYYVSPDGTPPYFDRIVYKFFGNPGDNNLAALHSGTCDIIDSSVNLQPDLQQILEDVRDGYQAVYIRPELTRQEIVLNMDPNRLNVQDVLADTALRKALTACIDREQIGMELLRGQSEIPVDFYPTGHSSHDPELTEIAYAPEKAIQELETLGWTIPTNSERPIRIATRAAGIVYGTELAFTLYTSDSAASQRAGEMIRDNLEQCGVGITLEPLPLGELYTQGPNGVIFGRSFDMALFSWSASQNPCALYQSSLIPNETNHWVGTNAGSFVNEAYDEACLIPEFSESDARQIFSEELPAIPLYFNISMALSSNNICGLSDQIGSRSILWNLEQLSRSDERCAVSQWNNIFQENGE